MLTLLIFKLAGMVTAAAVPTAAVMGLWYLNRRWHLRLSALELPQTGVLAQEAVMATEQRYKDAATSTDTNRQKLDFATRHLLKHLRRAGIKIDPIAAEGMIEAQVNRLRNRDAVTTQMLPAEKRGLAWTSRDP